MERFDLKSYARAGALARLSELEQERRTILRLFPDLRDGQARSARSASSETTARRSPKRRRISAEARKKMSDAAKKRWAAQKAKA